ncbi:rifin [Plasmodium reichenowi]|uniref:Rifin n=1 Tax=Plasmodium reichenowi TaxID=5854 RepID=A0A060RMH2_PLARE|nr:rifin [Plasmodium reichenowi]
MKLHYPKILLICLPLNILLTSSSNGNNNNNNNESHITPHHTQTNRSLCESDIESSIYDNDAEMKSVKENFNRQTSQRFEKYEELMQEKRQKRKEERDKNIQNIIEKDKMDKSLVEKVEKGCLRCGCGLGGVAASVGLFGGLGIYGSEMAATAVAAKAAGIAEGLKVGLESVIAIAKLSFDFPEGTIPAIEVADLMAVGKFTDGVSLHGIFECISSNIKGQWGAQVYNKFFLAVDTMAKKTLTEFNEMNPIPVAAVEKAVTKGEEVAIAATHAKYTHLYSAIGYSVLAILIIVLVMIIIYLILRYRRKKKMEKKDKYTKLLNQ